MTFRGTFRHSLDAKARVILPVKFREALGDAFILTIGLDNCLFAFTTQAFEQLEEKILALPIMDKNRRRFEREFIGSASDCEFDAQGRVVVPPNLREHANITKDVVSVGLPGRVEIWSRENWENYNNNIDEDLAEKMAELGI